MTTPDTPTPTVEALVDDLIRAWLDPQASLAKPSARRDARAAILSRFAALTERAENMLPPTPTGEGMDVRYWLARFLNPWESDVRAARAQYGEATSVDILRAQARGQIASDFEEAVRAHLAALTARLAEAEAERQAVWEADLGPFAAWWVGFNYGAFLYAHGFRTLKLPQDADYARFRAAQKESRHA